MSENLSFLQDRFRTVYAVYRRLQDDLSKAVHAQAKLQARMDEIEIVQEQIEHLSPSSLMYKEVGSSLVEFSAADVRRNILRRLEHLRLEMELVERRLADLSEKTENRKIEILQLEKKITRASRRSFHVHFSPSAVAS
ncbi:hypothetical protein EIP91_006191 [Steccherinum ochraceum]|uniref:Uncharacterized protein n=1 Tax=Steccherinum ochraceum TaxID=92696 RepID=A0A4R0R619_9APHY|nr:hypothetical protein EIP91_006191 [Steccherinum ochraceum]